MKNKFTLIVISYFTLGITVCFGQTKENYTDGGILYARVTFKNSGNWSVPQGLTSLTYLVVGAGGGGGGAYDAGAAGGGGGGQVLTGTLGVSAGNSLNVVIGIGGTGGTANRSAIPPEYGGNNGGLSSFGPITANGGTGGQASRASLDGLGGAVNTGGNGGGAVAGGATGGGGGGGGATATGSNGNSSSGGTGGAGTSSSLSGIVTVYGNGGNGGLAFSGINGSSPIANTGNGGNGAGSAASSSLNGRPGASGIVIIIYPEVDPVLPVGFKLFKATASANAINLHWETTSESNNSHYIIKRSTDGVNFENMGKVEGKGNTNEISTYTLVDKQPKIGINYYQLIQVDDNGKMTTLSTKSTVFDVGKIANSSAHPNPFTNSVSSSFEKGIFNRAILSDISGKVLASIAIEKEAVNCTFKTEKYPSGIYFIKLSGTQAATHKVIKR